MITVTSDELVANFDFYLDAVETEEVAITVDGEIVAYLISIEEYERLEAMKNSISKEE